jgi:hypothetical protein
MPKDASTPPSPLLTLARESLPGTPQVVELIRAFWGERLAFRREFAASLLAIARGQSGEPWEVRCLAALMLQHQWLCLSDHEVAEHSNFFRLLGLKSSEEPDGPLDDRVLEEGYSTTRLAAFVGQFRRRLGRRGWPRDLRSPDPPPDAWETLFLLVREECSIDLGRYVFSPREVADRILASFRLSTGGEAEPLSRAVPQAAREATIRWPPFEREVIAALLASGVVYWAGESTGRRLNALVAQPPGTVVAVVRPPGSDLELEIKRVGRPGRIPLDVVFERDGQPVPPSHRLDGGSMASSLRFEAAAAARLSTIHRGVWKRPAPVPATLSTRLVGTVAVGDGTEWLLDYFTDPRVFADRFDSMRSALALAVDAFERTNGSPLEDLPGDLGLSVRFLYLTAPGQSILAGTSMFRLDLIARLLGTSGADWYFGQVGGPAPGRAERRRLADAVLEQVLGFFAPPRIPYRDHAEYLESVFADDFVRARADRVFRTLMRQIGTFWGTLLAVRGYSNGESLVARNVGIAATWSHGRWRVGLVFMDHDDLHLPAHDQPHYRPDSTLSGMIKDEAYAVGASRPRGGAFSSADFLRGIYRVSPTTADEGQVALRRAFGRAYRRTRRAVRAEPALSSLFCPSFLDDSDAWDRAISESLRRGIVLDGDHWREALGVAASNDTLRKAVAKIDKPLLAKYLGVARLLGLDGQYL